MFSIALNKALIL